MMYFVLFCFILAQNEEERKGQGTGLGLAPYVAGIFTFAPDIIDLLEQQAKICYECLVTSVNSDGTKWL